jgi:hypothetical protein
MRRRPDMANHLKPIPAPIPKPASPPPPRIEWGQIVKVGDLYHLATMVTQGDRIIEQRLGTGNGWRPVIEAEFQRFAVEKVLDRNDS